MNDTATLIVTATVIGLLFAWLAQGARRISQVTKGPKITHRNASALLLIDLQTVFWEGPAYDNTTRQQALDAILSEAEKAMQQGMPIIAIRHEWSEVRSRLIAKVLLKGAGIAGSAGTEIAHAFSELPAHVITKGVQDAFASGELETLLQSLDVGTLRIAGLDGEHCVARTAESALGRGYNVQLLADAIVTANKPRWPLIVQKLTEAGASVH